MHISQVINKPKTLGYWRNPTKAEIKFGYGATHYRDFDFDKCFDKDGFLKLKVKASDDGLTYYSRGTEWRTAAKYKIKILKV